MRTSTTVKQLLGLSLLAGILGCNGTPSRPDIGAVVLDMTPAATSKDMAQATTSRDMTPQSPTLTVNNTLDWCTVTVTVGNGTPTMFADASHVFTAAAGTTITLSATPNPSFFAVKWSGTTTTNGASATYLMSAAAAQSVTACCPTSAAGAGC